MNAIKLFLTLSVGLSVLDLSSLTITGMFLPLSNASLTDQSTIKAFQGQSVLNNLFCAFSWNTQSGVFSTNICDQLLAGDNVTIEFSILNPYITQESPMISIQIRGSVVNIPPVAIDKPNSDILLVPYGSNPLTIVVPAWSSKNTYQSSFLASALNVIVITLCSTVNLGYMLNTEIVISGLSNAIFRSPIVHLAGSNGSSLLFCNGNYSGSAWWDGNKNSSLILNFCPGKIFQANIV